MDSKDQFDATFDDHLLNNHKIISEDDEDEDDKMQMVIVEDDESDDYLKHSLVGFCQVFIEEEEEKTKGNGENSHNKNRSSAETNPEVLVVRQDNSVRNRKKKSSVEKVDGTNIKKLQVLSCMHCLYKTSKNGKIKSHVRKHRCKIADCRCYNAAGCDLAQHPLKRFLCTFCHDRFNTLVALARHCENRHAANNPFSCQLCDYSCSKSADLRRHSQSHRRPTVSHRYRCELCDFSSGYPGVLKRHIIAQHKDAEPYTCDLCAYDTWLGEEFEKHKILHENYEYQGPLVCEICNYQGNDCREFSRHVRTHKKDYPYSCDGFNCFFRGATPDSLKQHVKRSHRKHKLFKCSLCSFKGTSQDDLKVHVSVLHSNCDFCGQNFVDEDDLQKHVKSNLCYKGERFDEFKQHLEAHSVQFPFGCEFCLFKGATWTDLSDHLAMHKDKKPFRCDLCDFRYSDTADFDEHFKVHLNWFVKFES